LLDDAPTTAPATVLGLGRSIVLANASDPTVTFFQTQTVFYPNTALPSSTEIPVIFDVDQLEGSIHFFVGPDEGLSASAADPLVSEYLGGLTVVKDIASEENLVLIIQMDLDQGLQVQLVTSVSKTVIQSLDIPFPK
jgi:hypothetical protein